LWNASRAGAGAHDGRVTTMSRDEGRLPALSPRQRDHVRRSREALVGGGLLSTPPGETGVPPVIEKSWRRCVGEQVPVAPERIDYRAPDDAVPALRRAAEPVLERLRWSLADVAVALVLSDAGGRIVVRHADVRRQRVAMDRASAAEGFDFSEHSIGTNGSAPCSWSGGPCSCGARSTTTRTSRR